MSALFALSWAVLQEVRVCYSWSPQHLEHNWPLEGEHTQAIRQKLDIMTVSLEHCSKWVPLHNIYPITGSLSRLLKWPTNFDELRIFSRRWRTSPWPLANVFCSMFFYFCHRQLRCLASCVHFLVICGQLNCAWFIPGALLWKFLQHRCVAYFMNYKPDCDYSSSTCEKKKKKKEYH